ncbi:UNVERIFIED_CONTAM: hypothetical protein GTU68_020475 [Idotea baltica]|nr:hypothetical protein [Idotea baltica]
MFLPLHDEEKLATPHSAHTYGGKTVFMCDLFLQMRQSRHS